MPGPLAFLAAACGAVPPAPASAGAEERYTPAWLPSTPEHGPARVHLAELAACCVDALPVPPGAPVHPAPFAAAALAVAGAAADRAAVSLLDAEAAWRDVRGTCQSGGTSGDEPRLDEDGRVSGLRLSLALSRVRACLAAVTAAVDACPEAGFGLPGPDGSPDGPDGP